MSLLNTKPRWAPQAIPTERGWVDPITKEVYVAIGNLKVLLEQENPTITETIIEFVKETKEEIMEIKEEPKVVVPHPVKKPGRPKRLVENTENKLTPGQQIIGEVVEYPQVTVIGE